MILLYNPGLMVYKQILVMILMPLFRPVQRFGETMGQDGNIAAHLT